MFEKKSSREKNVHGSKAQAIVEFAIVLPILLMVLIGILEVGRLIFIYSSVTNASRNASRYASAVGYEDTGMYHKFAYCDGIRAIAEQSAFLMSPADLTITISYDGGPGTSYASKGYCDATGGDDTDIVANIKTGDRVTVEVNANYETMVSLIPIDDRLIQSGSTRTILGILGLD